MPNALLLLMLVAYPFSGETLERDDIRACASRLSAMAGHGRLDYEAAAFLVLRDDGSFGCEVWPAARGFRRASWKGAIPDGTAAVIHTHPRSLPEPSAHDYDEARRIGVPVIVVAGQRLSMTARGGKNSARERSVSIAYTPRLDEATADSLPDTRKTGPVSHERSRAHP